MEAYFQSGNQPACHQEEGVPKTVYCPPDDASLPPGTAIAAYNPNPPIWTTPLNNGSPATPGITTQIMATESCMGCHSSAGIVTKYENGNKTTGGQLLADFSWLLSQGTIRAIANEDGCAGRSPDAMYGWALSSLVAAGSEMTRTLLLMMN